MLKVLVVDDEKLVRQMVMRCIDWKGIGLEIVGEASSSRMGMELVDSLHPDIVFMDVRMPGMNGLECSKKILEKHPEVKILILSGHDEFEYASEGIKIGVFDYLLKPINAEELQKAAVKVRNAILQERNHIKEYKRYKEELEKHASYIRDRQFWALVRSHKPEQYLESLEYFGVKLTGSIYQTALVQLEYSEEAESEEEKLLIKMYVREIAEDYYGDMPRVFVIDSGSEQLIIMNNQSENAIYEKSEELKRYLENNTDARISIGVGNIYQELVGLRKSYQEAIDALKFQFVSEHEPVICYRDVFPYYDTEQNIGLDMGILHEFGNAIRVSNTKKAEEQLENMLLRMKKSGKERDQILVYAMQILTEIMKAISELKIEKRSGEMEYSVMIEKLFQIKTFEEIQSYLKSMVNESCKLIGTEVSDTEKNLVHKVKDYLAEHYGDEDISLNALAELYFVNSSYLSRVFKEKIGMTFSNYLFELRMNAASSLVLRSDLKAYEIAERVGISDPHYFSSCFKKYTGMSVSDYRKQTQ